MTPEEGVFAHNQAAWDKQASDGNRWTIPVDAGAVARARAGDWSVILTPRKPVPREWFGTLRGADVLALASGGGQQAPLFAAAGAAVTIFDASAEQLARDRAVSDREGLGLRVEQGDMRDLSRFPSARFDLVFHPCSNCFVPDPRPVWREAARVLRPGGRLLSGFCLPTLFLVEEQSDEKGVIDVRYRIPYSDLDQLDPEALRAKREKKEPLSFGHSLEAQIGGQLDAGLLLAGYYEDSWEPGLSAISDRIPCFAATLALKPR